MQIGSAKYSQPLGLIAGADIGHNIIIMKKQNKNG